MDCVVIDDNREDREWITELLNQIQIASTTAFENIEDALTHLLRWKAHVVFVDYRLDNTRGLVFVASIRSRAPKAKIVVVTGQPFPSMEHVCDEFGVGLLIKSELTKEMLETVLE